MKLPKGWSANPPPAIHAKSKFATLDKTYKFENGTLTVDRRFEVLAEKIPAADWHIYHQWFKDAGLDAETYIQLANSSTLALDLLRQAGRAAQSNDWPTAKAKADQVRAADPDLPYLWSTYGGLALHDGDLKEAVADFRKELAEHPDESNITIALANTLMQQKKTDDAISVLQTAINRNPANEPLVIRLAHIIAQRGDKPAAEKLLRSGLTAKPDSLSFKGTLGSLLMNEHKNDEAEPLLRDVLTNSNDPNQLNDAAYELADVSLDLPLDETSSRHSLELLDVATNSSEDTARRSASLLAAAWDTLGWILYREGKFSDAEPWARAAWRNDNSVTTGYHLALVLEKENRLPEALNQLQLAQAGGGNSNTLQKLVADKLSDLRKSATPTDKNNPSQELQLARTYKLHRGRLNPKGQGWATVELNVTTQGTTAVFIVSGDQSLQPLLDAVQHLDLNLQLPPASHATLVRRAILACGVNDTTCQLVLIPS